MKILFVDTYYPGFLKNIRGKYPGLNKKSYDSQKKFLLDQCFGTSDFFSFNLKKLGWQADDIIVNDEVLQRKWAEENLIKVSSGRLFSQIQSLPFAYKILGRPKWMQEISLQQIIKYKPDIVYLQDLSVLNPNTLMEIKKHCRLLVGQIASPMPSDENSKCFDLIVTSFPHFVKTFEKIGVKSVYQQLAFETRILKKVKKQRRVYDVVFVGSFTQYHLEGTKMLEEVAKQISVHVWGQGLEFLSPSSPLRKNYHGEAWGLEMYKILAASKIVINRHIGVSGKYANNMRLYEVTGMGAMLITEKKTNLGTIFKVGKEVVDYKNSEELIDKLNYYLKNDKERERIAKAGQERTLKDHNYLTRMRELMKILNKYI